jgi:hypothetical protein
MSPGNECHESELLHSKVIPIWYDRFEDFLTFPFPVVGLLANITLPQFLKFRESSITFVSQSGEYEKIKASGANDC